MSLPLSTAWETGATGQVPRSGLFSGLLAAATADRSRSAYTRLDLAGADVTAGELMNAARDEVRPRVLALGRVIDIDQASAVNLAIGSPVLRAVTLAEPGAREAFAVPCGGSGWREAEPGATVFAPWAWRASAGELVHLPRDLRRRLETSCGDSAVTAEEEAIWRQSRTVRSWLARLFELRAERAANREITGLFRCGARADGRLCALRVRGKGRLYELSADGGATWAPVGTGELLADRCLLPYRVVARPGDAELIVRSAPALTPVLSDAVVAAVTAHLAPRHDRRSAYVLATEWAGPSDGPKASGQRDSAPERLDHPASLTAAAARGRPAGHDRSASAGLAAAVADLAEANGLPPLLHVILPRAPLALMPSWDEPRDAVYLSRFLVALTHRLAGFAAPSGADRLGDARFQDAALRIGRSVYAEWPGNALVSARYRGKFSGRPPARGAPVPLQAIRTMPLWQTHVAVKVLSAAWELRGP